MSQTQLLSRAACVALTLVSVAFFIFAILKAPVFGAVKVSLALMGAFKCAFFALTGLVWLYLNYKHP